MIEVELPDGTILEVDADTPEAAAIAARNYMRKNGLLKADPGAMPAPPIAGAAPYGDNLNWNDPGYVAENTPTPRVPEPESGPLRALQVGAQGVGRGLADLAGLPVDLASMAMDAGGWAAERGARALGYEVELPRFTGRAVGGSDSIREGASAAADAAGVPAVPYDEMSGSEQLAYNVSRFGTEAVSGATGLARTATARFAQPGTTPRMGDTLLRPYVEDPAAAVARDAGAGVGAGAAVTGVDQLVPENSSFRPAADLLAVLAGGVTGAEAVDAATRVPSALARRATGGIAPEIPLDEASNPTSVRVADKTARVAQEGRSRTENEAVARSIGDEAERYRAEGLPVPTSGVLSDDPGLAGLESGVRSRNRSQFVAPDQRVQSAAIDRVAGMAPENADTTLPGRVAQQRYDAEAGAARETRSLAQGELDAASRQQLMADQEASQIGGRVAVTDPTTRMQRASGEFAENVIGQPTDTAAPNGGLRAMTREKNRLFAAPDAEVEISPLAETAQTVRDGISRLQAANMQAPVGVLDRLDKLMPRLSSETVESGLVDAAGGRITRQREKVTGGSGTASWQELSSLYADLDAVKRSARSARMSPEYLDAVDALKAGIRGIGRNLVASGTPEGQQIEAAERFFRETYAPVWGRDRPVNSVLRDKALWGEVPPDPATVLDLYKLTGKPTPTMIDDLARVVQVAKSPAEAQNAVRRYVAADLGASVVEADGRINPRKLRAWRDSRAALWGNPQFAELRQETDDLLQATLNNDRRRTELRGQVEEFAARLKAAEANETATLRRLNNSALRVLIDNEPAQAAREILSIGRGKPIERAREVRALLEDSPDALEGWQRAVSDELRRRVQTTRLTPDGDRELSLGQLIRQVDDLSPVLAEVFDPDQMNALTQARRLLEPYQRLSVRTPGGSYDRAAADLWSAVSLVNRALFGVLKGGGVTRTLKDLFGRIYQNDEEAVNALLVRMMTDPDLAQHLLRRPVDEVGTPIWNKRLFQMIGLQEATSEE